MLTLLHILLLITILLETVLRRWCKPRLLSRLSLLNEDHLSEYFLRGLLGVYKSLLGHVDGVFLRRDHRMGDEGGSWLVLLINRMVVLLVHRDLFYELYFGFGRVRFIKALMN